MLRNLKGAVMGFGPQSVFSVTLASSATLTTSSVDLSAGWERVWVEVPTMPSGSLYLHGSSDNTTFRRLQAPPSTATVVLSTHDFTIDSSATQRMVPVPLGGTRYLKVENSTGSVGATVFNFICK